MRVLLIGLASVAVTMFDGPTVQQGSAVPLVDVDLSNPFRS